MRVLMVLPFLLSGCGLLLDLDPPDVDAGGGDVGQGPDAQGPDVPPRDGGVVDGAAPDIDSRFDAGFDVPPFDGGPCLGHEDCVDETSDCEFWCVAESCELRFDDDGDGICNAEDCREGEVMYPAPEPMCSTRSAVLCKNSRLLEIEFDQIETCNGRDDTCNNLVDESPSFECGVGSCSGGYRCNEPCASDSATLDDCTSSDDDCDGKIDEDCPTAPLCDTVIVSGTAANIDGPGSYCFVVSECGGPVRNYVVTGDVDLTGVELYGDMYSAGGELRRCPRGGAPQTTLRARGTFSTGGATHAESIRFALGDMTPGPVISVERGGSFHGYGVEVRGGNQVALLIDDASSAYFGHSLLASTQIDGHTIDSQGALTIDASCPRNSNLVECQSPMATGASLVRGVFKSGDRGSAIFVHGANASLEMNQTAVLGVGNTAIEMLEGDHVAIFDSQIVSLNPQPLPGLSANTVSLLGCNLESTFRNTRIVNGSSTSAISTGVQTSECDARFHGRSIATVQPDIVGSNTPGVAIGVWCGRNCSFADMFVVGSATRAEATSTVASGIRCEGRCSISDSRVVGFLTPDEVAGEAVGVQMNNGEILRSSLAGGRALDSVGVEVTGRATIQDSLALGLPLPTNAVIGAIGVGVRGVVGANVGILHSTVAAREWVATFPPDGVECRAIEAAEESRFAIFNSLLLSGRCFVSRSFVSSDPDALDAMRFVGLDGRDAFLIGGLMSALPPFEENFVIPTATNFGPGFVPQSPLPPGQAQLVTPTDISGAMRTRGSLGAHD